jgi:hypothetical protein
VKNNWENMWHKMKGSHSIDAPMFSPGKFWRRGTHFKNTVFQSEKKPVSRLSIGLKAKSVF